MSTLICSGQISRDDALNFLEQPLYDENELIRDRDYVLKKFGLTEEEWEDIMSLPVKQHAEFKTNLWIRKILGAG
jgi:hypothetical protein